LVLFGLISIGWATIFILGQTDYKRMLRIRASSTSGFWLWE
jgi:formate hydrogenlyase subunit 3/multisubunit Na+/H+ antiporter MnhD subunit